MEMSSQRQSLYVLLAESPPNGAPAGETVTTRRKETLDNDAEAIEFDLPLGGEVDDNVASSA